MSLDDGARACLISLIGTATSNLTVASPFEVAICPRDQMTLSHRLKLDDESPELQAISHSWHDSLSRAFYALPRFNWEQGGDGTDANTAN